MAQLPYSTPGEREVGEKLSVGEGKLFIVLQACLTERRGRI